MMMTNPKLKIGVSEVSPVRYPIKRRIKLDMPTLKGDAKFIEVLENRKSHRIFQPIGIDELSPLLWYSARCKSLDIQSNGQILSHRPYPSAGAIHPIDILVDSPALSDNHSLFLYDPFDSSLCELDLPHLKTRALNEHIKKFMNVKNATVLWFVSQPELTKAKYKKPESLIWRDAGAALLSIQLVSTALSLSSCPLGTLGEPHISKMLKPYGNAMGVGCILIG